jgi:repressor LexA
MLVLEQHRHEGNQMEQPEQDSRDLTPRQREVIRVISESVRRTGYWPSLREIGGAVGLSSTSSVSHQLGRLQERGLVTREPGRPRTTMLAVRGLEDAGPGEGTAPGQAGRPGTGEVADVPLVGQIAAGIPLTAAELPGEVIPLPRALVGHGDLMMLSVTGESMSGAAIADGDWVVVRRQPIAVNGDIVAAMLDSDTADGAEATVKTYRERDGHVWLMPHNPAFDPIQGDSATIIGKVVSVLRRVG